MPQGIKPSPEASISSGVAHFRMTHLNRREVVMRSKNCPDQNNRCHENAWNLAVDVVKCSNDGEAFFIRCFTVTDIFKSIEYFLVISPKPQFKLEQHLVFGGGGGGGTAAPPPPHPVRLCVESYGQNHGQKRKACLFGADAMVYRQITREIDNC